jgi:hypothetical protein
VAYLDKPLPCHEQTNFGFSFECIAQVFLEGHGYGFGLGAGAAG